MLNEEFVLFFCLRLGGTQSETFEKIKKVFWYEAMSAKEYVKSLKEYNYVSNAKRQLKASLQALNQ